MSKKPVTPVEPVVEIVAEALPKPVIPEPVRKHVVKDGDTYPSIAGLYKPSGVSKHEYATHLFDLNKGMALIIGTEVAL